jgi:hypothetical protein
MPTFLQETFSFAPHSVRRKRKRAYTRKKSRVKRRAKTTRKRSGYAFGKEGEAIIRTTGALMATGAAIGTMGLIGKLGK